MKNKILPFSIIIFFGLIFFILYKGLDESKIYIPKNNIKNKIPIFYIKDFYSGQTIKSSKIFELDKIYLLNIWSSWCVPCRQEHPLLMKLNLNNEINIII